MPWNRCPVCAGLGVQFAVEWVSSLARKTQLYWHRNGFCLWLKRLEAEKFAWPRDAGGATQGVTLQQFEWLLEGFDVWQKPPHKTLHFTSVS